jgi:hypothetical protein
MLAVPLTLISASPPGRNQKTSPAWGDARGGILILATGPSFDANVFVALTVDLVDAF